MIGGGVLGSGGGDGGATDGVVVLVALVHLVVVVGLLLVTKLGVEQVESVMSAEAFGIDLQSTLVRGDRLLNKSFPLGLPFFASYLPSLVEQHTAQFQPHVIIQAEVELALHPLGGVVVIQDAAERQFGVF